jgi:chemotaxis protein CheD
MKVYAAGAARLLDDAGIFDIGRRNYLAFQKCIWRLGAVTRAESVGGTESRSAKLDLATGRFLVRRGRDSERELT